jgi:hypothetical protein
MPLTRSFRETIKEQLANKDFRREFLRESVGNMVAGDLETAKAVPAFLEALHSALQKP